MRTVHNIVFFWKVRNSKTLITVPKDTNTMEYRFAIENGYKVKPKPLETYIIIDPDKNQNNCQEKPIQKSVHFEDDLETIELNDSGKIPPDSKYPEDIPPLHEVKTPYTELFQKLIYEASLIPGTIDPRRDEFENDIFPEWLDFTKIQTGKQFIQKHYFSIIFSHLISLLLILTIRPIQAVLLRTTSKVYKNQPPASSPNTPNLLYFQFLNYVLKWYRQDFDFSDPNYQNEFKSDVKYLKTLLYQSSQNFKKFIPPLAHELQLTDENELLKFTQFKNDLICSGKEIKIEEYNARPKVFTTINPEVPISQYDLAILSYSFWGILQTYPKTFGIYESSEAAFEGYVHLWGFLGHAFGLEDAYNLAILEKEKNSNVFNEIFKFSFITLDTTTWKLWTIMTQAFNKYFLCVKMDCLVYYMTTALFQLLVKKKKTKAKKPKDSNPAQQTTYWESMSFMSKICYYHRNLWLNYFLRWFIFRICLNLCTKFVVWIGWMIYLRPIELNSNQSKNKSTHKKTELHVKWSNSNGIELVNLNA